MGKKLFFYLLMTIFVLAMLEAFAFVTTRLVDQEDFFDHREIVLHRLNKRNISNAVEE